MLVAQKYTIKMERYSLTFWSQFHVKMNLVDTYSLRWQGDQDCIFDSIFKSLKFNLSNIV